MRASVVDVDALGSNASLKERWKIWFETPLEDLGVGTSVADVEALGCNASLEDGWKIWSETPLADVCRIGIETSLVGDGGLGAGASVADVWRIISRRCRGSRKRELSRRYADYRGRDVFGRLLEGDRDTCHLARLWHRRTFSVRHRRSR